MEDLLLYTGKVSLTTAAFYIAFQLLFRRQKQFLFNRLFLLLSMATGFIIPFITITLTRAELPQLVILPGGNDPEVITTVNQNNGFFTLSGMLFYSYLAGSIFFFIRLLAGHIKAWEIIRNCRTERINGTPLLVSDAGIHPFTFFSKVVIARETLAHPHLSMILEHEKVHAREKHTFDIMLSELMFIFQWFNPFAWLQKDAIKNNLEFLADHEVISHTEMTAYQLAMVSLAGKKSLAPSLNAFNGNNLKNRIIMMKMKTEKSNMAIRRLALLPLLVLLILGLSRKEFRAAPSHLPVTSNPEKLLSQENEVRTSSPGDTVKGRNKEIVVIGYPLKADTVKKQTKEIVVVGYQVTDTVKTLEDGDETGKTRTITRTFRSHGGNDPLYILDGWEVESIDDISPDQIESISVLKNASSVAIYGEKGKNGVIVITSKKQGKKSEDALIIIDGKETSIPINEIDPGIISSINVLKGESATKKYGQKGEKGVIEITLKKYTEEMSTVITTIGQLRNRIAQNIRYPVKAQENGEQSLVKVYAFVNGEGAITEITTSTPASGFQKVDEVVVVGYGPSSVSLKQVEYSSSLVQEASLQIKKLPDLAIEQFKNRWVEFQFKFMLQ